MGVWDRRRTGLFAPGPQATAPSGWCPASNPAQALPAVPPQPLRPASREWARVGPALPGIRVEDGLCLQSSGSLSVLHLVLTSGPSVVQVAEIFSSSRLPPPGGRGPEATVNGVRSQVYTQAKYTCHHGDEGQPASPWGVGGTQHSENCGCPDWARTDGWAPVSRAVAARATLPCQDPGMDSRWHCWTAEPSE